MRIAELSGVDYYLYLIQTGDGEYPVYMRTAGRGTVIIATKERLLNALHLKRFSIG